MKNNIHPGDLISLPLCRHERDGLFLRENDYYRKFLYDEILCVEASGSYSYFHLRDKRKVLIALHLGLVEIRLPESLFIRVHRGFILSLFDIDTFVGNSLKIGEQWFPLGDSYRPRVIAALNILDRRRTSSSIP